MSTLETSAIRPVSGAVRGAFGILLAASGYTFLVLFVFSGSTESLFAWRMSPLTAATLGGAYGATVVMFLSAMRAERWVDARIAAYPALVLLMLMLAATLADRDALHLREGSVIAFGAAWGWLALHVMFPIALLGALVAQRFAGGKNPPRPEALPLWVSGPTVVFGLELIGAGIALSVAPKATSWWAWTVTPMDARAIGAWCLALGLGSLLTVGERDLDRVRPGLYSYILVGVLGLVALVRYGGEVQWSSVTAWLYLGALLWFVVAGLTGLTLSAWLRDPSRPS